MNNFNGVPSFADFNCTADSSATYRERTGVDLARSTSSAETGNLAAATKNSTFQCGPSGVQPTLQLPRSHATASRRY